MAPSSQMEPSHVPKCTDPRCPCQDGDACHYEDTETTKAWPMPPGVEKFDKMGGVGWPE